MSLIFKWAGRSRGIPDHVPTGTPSGDPGIINPADAVLQITLENTVQLKTLASGNPERSVAEIPRDPVVREILLRTQGSARQLGANHEHPGFVEVLLFARRSLVTVVLLISTVKLQELILFVRKVRLVSEKSFLDATAQGMTFRLNFFDAFGSHSS
jgi:hypothetical protein